MRGGRSLAGGVRVGAARSRKPWARGRSYSTMTPPISQAIEGQSIPPVLANTPEEFAKVIKAEAEKWGAIGKRLGVTMD